MSVFTKRLKIKPTEELDMLDITQDVSQTIKQSKIKNGITYVHVLGSTASIIFMEFEEGLKKDLASTLERVVPKNIRYSHHDDNGHSHIRASLLGSGVTVPFENGKLLLGTWQQIVFVDLDTRERNREIVVQVIGE